MPTEATKRRRVRRILKRGALTVLGLTASYFLAVCSLGAIAVNRDYRQASTGVDIWVWNQGVHTDLVLPIRSATIDWTAFAPLEDPAILRFQRYVAIGWGDHDFYVLTPRWDDLSIGTTLKAVFWPSATVMHVTYHALTPLPGPRCVKLTLTATEYRELVTFIRASFRLDASGRPMLLKGESYWSSDAFYHAEGSYHLLDTCNNWTNRALKHIGVRTAAWSPFAYAIFDHLEGR